jgi:hypothetical protein
MRHSWLLIVLVCLAATPALADHKWGRQVRFAGIHPIPKNEGGGICYIEGPHYHYFEPPDGDDFKLVGNAYFYVGTPPPVMLEARPQYIGINAYYKPIVYTRPVIEVEPPSGWIGLNADFVTPVVVAPAAVVVDHRAAVVAPGVSAGISVNIPVPTVSIGVGVGVGGGVLVRGGGHGKWKHGKRH